MKRILITITSILAILLVSSCSTDYYEPVFGIDNLPAVIPASGGTYSVEYVYEYYDTKTSVDYVFFEWDCRVIVDGVVISSSIQRGDGSNKFIVGIPSNFDSYPKSVLVEASTHVNTGVEDWWGDWTPVASAVQLAK